MTQIRENGTSEPHGRHSLKSQLCPKCDICDKDTSGKQSPVSSAFLGANQLFSLTMRILFSVPQKEKKKSLNSSLVLSDKSQLLLLPGLGQNDRGKTYKAKQNEICSCLRLADN